MNRKINLLQFICPTGFYGAERWILALAHHLPKNRINCDLAVTQEAESRNLELVKQYNESKLGMTHEIPMSNPFDISVINKLVNLIRENHIHIIHTHGYKSDILGVIAARKAGIKSVVTPHGFENSSDLKLRFFIWLGCKAMAYADRVVPLSPQLMNDAHNAGIQEKRLHYIGNGVDLSEIELYRQKQPIAKTRKRIGFIGQLISRKNITDLLDVFDRLAARYSDLELCLLGDGEQRKELEKYADGLMSRSAIHFLGFRNDRLELLKSFDLFVMTSTLEGIPRCLMEACAMGVPVAAYDIPGIDRIITHEDTGLLARLGDKETLQSHWETLLFDTKHAELLAKNAYDYVNKNFSAKRMAKEYTELFDQLLHH